MPMIIVRLHWMILYGVTTAIMIRGDVLQEKEWGVLCVCVWWRNRKYTVYFGGDECGEVQCNDVLWSRVTVMIVVVAGVHAGCLHHPQHNLSHLLPATPTRPLLPYCTHRKLNKSSLLFTLFFVSYFLCTSSVFYCNIFIVLIAFVIFHILSYSI